MSELVAHFTEESLTFNKRLGWVNTQGHETRGGRMADEVTHFFTRFGLPVVVPDQWEDQTEYDEFNEPVGIRATLERVPDDVAVISIVPSDNSPSIKLWHDDIRRPPDKNWAWVRTNEDAMLALSDFRVREISIDHDMGLHDADPDAPGADFTRLPDEIRDELGIADGWELAEWMVEEKLVPQRVEIHSMAPEGSEKIASILRPHCLHLQIQPFTRWF